LMIESVRSTAILRLRKNKYEEIQHCITYAALFAVDRGEWAPTVSQP
jgi:hypothetical protein